MDATPDALYEIARFIARHGVTHWLPTTLTDAPDRMMAALENIKRYMRDQPNDAAQVIGARLEGPYLNRTKAGAQNPSFIRSPAQHAGEWRAFLDLDVIRIVDVAPEIEGADDLIAECARRGVIASAAHTDATADQVLRAHALGLRHSTHTYNAQSPLHHREPGVVGAVLATPTFSAEVICDGVHVHPLAVAILVRLKRDAGNICLITDAIRPAGMPDGDYAFDQRRVFVRGGAARMADGALAGSVSTMDAAARLLRHTLGLSVEALIPFTSANAARLLGMPDVNAGSYVIVDDDLNVLQTVIA